MSQVANVRRHGPAATVGRGLAKASQLLLDPKLATQFVLKHWPNSDFLRRLRWDAMCRPAYAYGAYNAALQASRLGLDAVSVVEFGVANGEGLLELENHSGTISRLVGVRIDVYGFDTGSGMPAPADYRDLPYYWKAGYFRMDVPALRHRLQRAQLVLGDVAVTVPQFLRSSHAPLGFVSFDLDYYSATTAALAILGGDAALLLPRVFCYFDDIIGDDLELHSPYAGELLAIEEFNARQPQRKAARIHGLAYKRNIPAPWNEQLFVLHAFDHPLYSVHIGPRDWQLQSVAPTGRS